MLNALSVKNFRKLVCMDIDGLKRITLISGKNNIGKSTILEALFLLMDHDSQNSVFKRILKGSTGIGKI